MRDFVIKESGNETLAQTPAFYGAFCDRCGHPARTGSEMKRFLLPVMLTAVLLLCACAQPRQDSTYAMSTYFSQTVYGQNAQTVVEENKKIVLRLENELSSTLSTSEICRANSAGVYTLSESAAEIVQTALEISRNTDDAFCTAVRPLVELWDIGGENHIPTETEKQQAAALCDSARITLEGNRLTLNGARIDLGGIAKGYALDKLAENTKQQADSALLDLGGSLYVLGDKQGTPYRVGIRDPFGEAGDLLGTMELRDLFVSTSGIYERFFEQEGVRYHHLLDVKTGAPAQSGVAAVSVVAESGTQSDAYSTALFVMGAEKGLAFAEKNGVDALFVLTDGSIRTTQGFLEKYNVELKTP